ncbi:MAG TPA: hypothetical protein DIT67_01530, partial [Octadecabacter sp.]|nr:hypothetical protein [Octadecabacter sp.]
MPNYSNTNRTIISIQNDVGLVVTRIFLHSGFHKTGTSSIQAFLAKNRDILKPFVKILLLDELPDVVRLSTRFSVSKHPLDLFDFQEAFCAFASNLAHSSDARPILISCEGLSGRSPGKKGITTYKAATLIAQSMIGALEAEFSDSLDLSLIFTTREPNSWLKSVYKHNLHGYRITDT